MYIYIHLQSATRGNITKVSIENTVFVVYIMHLIYKMMDNILYMSFYLPNGIYIYIKIWIICVYIYMYMYVYVCTYMYMYICMYSCANDYVSCIMS